MRNLLVFCVGILTLVQPLKAQAPEKLSSTEIFLKLQKLNFLGTALYIAAHPDDENTRLISYLSNEVKARTGYLSITRGDGGQNLIGSELRELLGVLRTQELLAARRVDGGEQFFTRANDFGYSKHSDETLKLWDKEAVLGDVVRVIRNFRPDVIINRFDHRTPGETHGHHTSSAILSTEAFSLAADKMAYPEQLEITEIWQPKRLFFNTSWWFYGSQENFEKADKSKMLSMDIGVFYPIRGLSNNEIASMASSQHLSQGFGRLTSRGSEIEYIELLKGDMPKDHSNIFEGIDTSWSRIEGGEEVGDILEAVEENFNFENPSKHVAELVKAYTMLQSVKDEHWKRVKSNELKELIAAVMGLYLEVSTEQPSANPGADTKISLELLNRSTVAIQINSVEIANKKIVDSIFRLNDNKDVSFEVAFTIPEATSYTSPYWLVETGSIGMYKVTDLAFIGKPETPKAFVANFNLEVNGTPLTISRPLIYRFSEPDKGEIYNPFEIVPEATSSFEDKVIIFADNAPRKIPVVIRAHRNNFKGTVTLVHSEGWKVAENNLPIEIMNKSDEKTLVFTVTPPDKEDESFIKPVIAADGKEFTKELVKIAYDHIPTQSVLLPSEAKVVRLNIKKAGENIGYIAGAGDDIPKSLEQIGYTVHTVDPATIQAGSLQRYDAVVVGIRAYNVIDELKFKQRFLLDYVKEGGNLILQYNTAGRRGLDIDNIAPFALQLSRDRVTDENSEVEIIAKDHSLVTYPNIITAGDFDNWVQERGLYFPDEWDAAFTPIFSMYDSGETPKKGSLLVAPYGKGNYIYTGLSFFRELPAGVSGAYKLFANMLSIGKDIPPKQNNIKG